MKNTNKMFLLISGPGGVPFVQCRCVHGWKLSFLSLHLPHSSVLANIHKQQLFGIGGILAAGARSLTGGLLRSHQHTSTLSSRWVKRLSKIRFLTLKKEFKHVRLAVSPRWPFKSPQIFLYLLA